MLMCETTISQVSPGEIHRPGRSPGPPVTSGNHPERLPNVLETQTRSYKRTQGYDTYGGQQTGDNKAGDNPNRKQTGDPASIDVGKRFIAGSGPRSNIAFPKNYIPLPDGRENWNIALSIMNGAGHNLDIEYEGRRPRLQEQNFKNEADREAWRQAEWRRQKSRRRFSNYTVLQDVIQKRYATNEAAQAAINQKQFKHPSSENRFYAMLRGMSALFGTIE